MTGNHAARARARQRAGGRRLGRLRHVPRRGELLGADTRGGEQLGVEFAGATVEQAGPRHRGRPGKRVPDQPSQDVLAQGPPRRGRGDDARLRGREPAHPRGVVARVQAGAGALLHCVLVDLLPQCGHRVGAAGVGVGEARCERTSGPIDRDQRGGEGVHRDAADAGPQPPVACHRVEDLLDLRTHLIGIDDRGAVGGNRERVRHLVLQAVDPPTRRVVHPAPGGGGPDVQREHQWVQRRIEGDVVIGPGHRSPRLRRRGLSGDPSPT